MKLNELLISCSNTFTVCSLGTTAGLEHGETA